MKIKQLTAIALALGLTAWSIAAQNDGPPGQGQPPEGNQGRADGPPPGGGPGGKHRRPPPFMEALDADHDGVISADEIANAAKALLTLDKKGTGKVTLEEFLGPPPGHRPGGPNGDQNGDQTRGPNGNGNGDQPRRPQPGNQGNGPGNQGQDRPHPPLPPIFVALDTDGDGVLSADEIANAPKTLLKLDKNGDGKLTLDELRPEHRPMPRDPNSNN